MKLELNLTPSLSQEAFTKTEKPEFGSEKFEELLLYMMLLKDDAALKKIKRLPKIFDELQNKLKVLDQGKDLSQMELADIIVAGSDLDSLASSRGVLNNNLEGAREHGIIYKPEVRHLLYVPEKRLREQTKSISMQHLNTNVGKQSVRIKYVKPIDTVALQRELKGYDFNRYKLGNKSIIIEEISKGSDKKLKISFDGEKIATIDFGSITIHMTPSKTYLALPTAHIITQACKLIHDYDLVKSLREISLYEFVKPLQLLIPDYVIPGYMRNVLSNIDVVREHGNQPDLLLAHPFSHDVIPANEFLLDTRRKKDCKYVPDKFKHTHVRYVFVSEKDETIVSFDTLIDVASLDSMLNDGVDYSFDGGKTWMPDDKVNESMLRFGFARAHHQLQKNEDSDFQTRTYEGSRLLRGTRFDGVRLGIETSGYRKTTISYNDKELVEIKNCRARLLSPEQYKPHERALAIEVINQVYERMLIRSLAERKIPSHWRGMQVKSVMGANERVAINKIFDEAERIKNGGSNLSREEILDEAFRTVIDREVRVQKGYATPKFFELGEPEDIAQDLIGMRLTYSDRSAIITGVAAVRGEAENEVMYREPGRMFMTTDGYLAVSTNDFGMPTMVVITQVMPTTGLEKMANNTDTMFKGLQDSTDDMIITPGTTKNILGIVPTPESIPVAFGITEDFDGYVFGTGDISIGDRVHNRYYELESNGSAIPNCTSHYQVKDLQEVES